MNRAEGRADFVAQERNSVESRAELKAKADRQTLVFLHSFSPYFILHESAFFFWDAVIENPSWLRPSGERLRPKMGRSQYAKISPDSPILAI